MGLLDEKVAIVTGGDPVSERGLQEFSCPRGARLSLPGEIPTGSILLQKRSDRIKIDFWQCLPMLRIPDK